MNVICVLVENSGNRILRMYTLNELGDVLDKKKCAK